MDKKPKTTVETQGASRPNSYGARGYGKRSLWQWLLIYLVLAVIIYGAIYYFVIAKKGYSYGDESTGSSQVVYPPLPN